jgi:putative acetyltransferase
LYLVRRNGNYWFFGWCLAMKITVGDLASERVADLLGEHLEGMARFSPPESIHALDLDGLRAADITFWTIWDDEHLLGCGALKELDSRHGEIKSMRTANAHLRRGVATAMLQYLIDESRARSYRYLSLETGSGPAFEPADSLYKKFGFRYCGPFSNYPDDPFSRFMTLKL